MKYNVLFLCYALLCVPVMTHAQVTDTNAQWTWMKGSTATNQNGVYGTQGTPAVGNISGARYSYNTWTDQQGNFWLHGGNGRISATVAGILGDLWKYTPATNEWTWVKGPQAAGTSAYGVHGTKGTAHINNYPGARQSSMTWMDTAGKLWLFGGYGYTNASGGAVNRLSDLWRYDPDTKEWTWVSGPGLTGQLGVYGTPGVGDALNIPGARSGGAAWTDKEGKFWLFGGYGYGATGTAGATASQSHLNDLWRYDPATNQWTSMTPPNAGNQAGIYGTRNTWSAGNLPGGRYSSVGWADTSGMLWLFGGIGYGSSSASSNILNDLWQYDPVNNRWIWKHGADVISGGGTYGTRGVPDPQNTPAARYLSATWTDSRGKFWLLGGSGISNTNTYYNDLWRYDPVTSEWTWMKGTTATNKNGTYGTIEVPDPANEPGGRYAVMGWKDTAHNFWLLGGWGYPRSGTTHNILNDFWCLAPVLPDQPGLFATARPDVCQGAANVSYSVPAVAGATTYEWSYTGTNVTFSGGTSTAAPANTLTFSGTATSGTLRVRAVNAGGAGPYRDTAILVNPLPVAVSTNTGNQSICQGDSLLLSATTGNDVTYQWKDGTTNVGTGAVYYAKAGGSYTVTVTNIITNCSATSSPATALTVNPLPQATVTPSGSRSVCSGDSLLLSAATGANQTYQWKNGTANVDTGASCYAKAGGDYTVTVTNTVTNCVATSAATNVTVQPLPTAAVTPAGTQSICQGDSLLLSAATSSGVNYEWRLGPVPVGTNATYYASVAGSYTVRVTNTTTNCGATSPATTLTVHSLPSATVSMGGPAVVCQGDSVVLTAGTGTGYSYQWKNRTAHVGTGSNTYVAKATGSYKVVITDAGTGCKDSTQEVPVVVHPRPVVSLTPGDTAFCEGGAVTLEVSTQDTGLTYRWQNGTATIPLATAHFLEIDETGVYTVVTGRIQAGNCEDTTNPVAVTVYPLPVVNITWDDVRFHATPGYVSYQWSTGGQNIAGATAATFQPSANGGYAVTVTDSNGCTATSPVYNVNNVAVDDVLEWNSRINVYPNPADDLVHIASPVPVNVLLSSTDGKVMIQQINTSEINIGHLANGMYLLRITDRNGMLLQTRKLVKTGR